MLDLYRRFTFIAAAEGLVSTLDSYFRYDDSSFGAAWML